MWMIDFDGSPLMQIESFFDEEIDRCGGRCGCCVGICGNLNRWITAAARVGLVCTFCIFCSIRLVHVNDSSGGVRDTEASRTDYLSSGFRDFELTDGGIVHTDRSSVSVRGSHSLFIFFHSIGWVGLGWVGLDCVDCSNGI